MKQTALVVVAVLCLSAWSSVAEEIRSPQLRKVTATGNRDIITLDNDAQFKGVILREKDKTVRLLTVSPSGRIHQVDVSITRIKRIERLTPEARKPVRAKMEDTQTKQRAKAIDHVTPREVLFFWRAPGYFGYACDSLLHTGGIGMTIHYLTPAGIDLMQRTEWPDHSLRYQLVELHYRTLTPVHAAHQSIVNQQRKQ